MKKMRIEDIEDKVRVCRKCPLYKTRNKYVIGNGDLNSSIMFIGEAPGRQEDMQGKAFVGESGILLDKMLASVGLDRNHIYMSNVVKCRPPENRVPHKGEINACMDYLREQFLLMHPKIIVLLGSVAAKAIISPDFLVMKSHGEVIERKGVYFIATFHPSALLRDQSKKPLAWEDLKKLKKLIKEVNN
ncbi:MAG: uracil-DNA glycosylase [Bacillales bacterium]|nr:uracil-DNA glycosylase [Bacillales bacterium]